MIKRVLGSVVVALAAASASATNINVTTTLTPPADGVAYQLGEVVTVNVRINSVSGLIVTNPAGSPNNPGLGQLDLHVGGPATLTLDEFADPPFSLPVMSVALPGTSFVINQLPEPPSTGALFGAVGNAFQIPAAGRDFGAFDLT